MLKVRWFFGSIAIVMLFISASLGARVDGKPGNVGSEMGVPADVSSATLSSEASSVVEESDDDYSPTKDTQSGITLCEPPRVICTCIEPFQCTTKTRCFDILCQL